MAAGLAHEVKNPLGAIKGAAQLLEELDGAVQADPSSRDFIGIILEEVNRLDRVVGSFLDYARPHAGNPIPLDINAAVKRTLQILSSQRTDDEIDVKLELSEPMARVKIDPEQFRQVLINLMQNAIQAMDGRGRVTVSTSLRRLARAPWTSAVQSERGAVPRTDGSAPAIARRGLPDEAVELVEVSVKDTGPGISQKVKNYLFIPFFTTKEQGTGLGLAISQSIVQNAGGTIDVQSQSGAGTTFTIVLPSATDSLSIPAPAEVAARVSVAPSRPV
jgi:signal transduction histidine kinase